MIYLDTHVAVWLYAGKAELLSAPAADAMRSNDLLISPMVLLELQYLNECGRVKALPETLVASLGTTMGLSVCNAPFADVARHAIHIGWTRDPFDRLIVAQAHLTDAPLVTKDQIIRMQYGKAIW
jgi:PIN domain nuclease of toxin-antitoxin system